MREGGLNSLLEALRRLQLEQEALVRRPSRSQARTVRLRLFPPPPLGLPGRPAQPPDPCHPRPLPDEAAELLTPGGGDGPRGKPGGWGRGAACTWPLSAALAGRGGTGPPPDPKSTAGDGGGVCRLPRVQYGGRVWRSPPSTLAAGAPPRVGLQGAPSRAARSARSPGRPRSPAAGNSRSSPSSRRSAQPGLPRLPEGEPHAGRPRGPPSPPLPTRPGSHVGPGGGPARPPLPAPRAQRNAWQPRLGAILSGRGAAQPRCFWLFPGPRPASPGPRLPAEWGGSRGEGKGRAAAIRLGLGPRPRPGRRPAAVRTCALGRGRAGAAGLLIARLAPAAAPGRPLPARPSSGERGRPGHSLPSSGLRPHWIAPLGTSSQSPASISLPVDWG